MQIVKVCTPDSLNFKNAIPLVAWDTAHPWEVFMAVRRMKGSESQDNDFVYFILDTDSEVPDQGRYVAKQLYHRGVLGDWSDEQLILYLQRNSIIERTKKNELVLV